MFIHTEHVPESSTSCNICTQCCIIMIMSSVIHDKSVRLLRHLNTCWVVHLWPGVGVCKMYYFYSK